MVPFVRVTRDKRGYEHICLMRASGRRGKAGAPRVLYVFRTPPGVRVGREPFDESARRLIEEQNPGVYFDWKKLSVILPPPPDVEYWRERRRAEKAAKQARREEEREPVDAQAPASAPAVPGASEEGQENPEQEVDDGEFEAAELAASSAAEDSGEEHAVPVAPLPVDPGTAPATSVSPADAARPDGQHRRRRRRGGRGRRRHGRPEVSAQVTPDSPKVVEDPSKER